MPKQSNRGPFEFRSTASFDFHNRGPLSKDIIEDLCASFLQECHANNDRFVIIITGKGEKVRPLVSRYLARSKRVKTFRTAGYYNGQEGAFEVELVD
jgi:DNA-nicking Smr family endonuclease